MISNYSSTVFISDFLNSCVRILRKAIMKTDLFLVLFSLREAAKNILKGRGNGGLVGGGLLQN